MSAYRSFDTPAIELLPQLPGDGLQMHEVAESRPGSGFKLDPSLGSRIYKVPTRYLRTVAS